MWVSQGMREQVRLPSELSPLPFLTLKTHSSLRPTISSYIKSLWQHEWDENLNSKLHKVIPFLRGPPHTHAGGWRDQVVLSYYRIGHSWLTHAFLLNGELPPQWIGCQSPLTLKRILLNCVDLMALHDLFIKVKQNSLTFLRTAGLSHLI